MTNQMPQDKFNVGDIVFGSISGNTYCVLKAWKGKTRCLIIDIPGGGRSVWKIFDIKIITNNFLELKL